MEKLKSLNIKGNLFGGITAGIIALPLALAFGVASGLGAIAGMYGAIIVGFFAAIFGGTPTQVSGPTGPMTVVIASLVLLYPNNPSLVFTAVALAGLIQICISFTSIADFIRYVPYPVISGFMSGIGVIIICLQLTAFFGLEHSGAPITHIWYFITHLPAINFMALFISSIALLIVFFTPKVIADKFPPSLLAIIVCTSISIVGHLDVATIGAIPTGLPSIKIGLISFEQFKVILPAAASLAILGCIDSLLTSLVADSITKTKHNSRREVLGQGIGNTLAGMFGGIAGAGATMRTVVNVKSGATGRLSGVIHSILLLSVIFCFAPFASKIPLSVLSAILIKVGIDIVDYKFLKVLKYSPKSDLAVMAIVFLLTVVYDLIFAVGVGIVLASILFAARVSRSFEVDLVEPDELSEAVLDEDMSKDVSVVHINGIFFFGTTSQVLSRVEASFDKKAVIIDCSELDSFDISAVFALEDMILKLQDKMIYVVLVLKNRTLGAKLLKMGLDKVLAKKYIKYSVHSALCKAKDMLKA